MKTRTKMMGLAAVGIAVAGFAILSFAKGKNTVDGVNADGGTQSRPETTVGRTPGENGDRQMVGGRPGTVNRQNPVQNSASSDLNEQLSEKIQAAMDSENLKALLKILPQAEKSQDVDVRRDLVEALGWFGKEAMLELLPMMADPDESVAEAAVDNWKFALADIDDEKEKCANVEAVMKTLRNKDALEAIVMELDDCDDLVEVRTLVNVIESGNQVAAEVAREHYEFLTDEKYTDLDSANNWLAQNCVPDED